MNQPRHVSSAISALFAGIFIACSPTIQSSGIGSPPRPSNIASKLLIVERDKQASFDAQPADDGATRAAQEKFDRAAKLAMGTTRAAVTCHKTICRLDTSHDS